MIREMDQVVKLNLRQLMVFEVFYRLVAGTLCIKPVNQLLKFSLRMVRYSHLTMSNMGTFLWYPVIIIYGVSTLAAGMMLLVIEIGSLVTAYQASAHSRKIDFLVILRGALGKTWNKYSKGGWKLLPLALAKYLTMNSYLLIRLPIRIKSLNLVTYEILHDPTTRPELVLVVVSLVSIGIPTMLVFFTCMTEQKGSRGSFRRSLELLGGR